MTPPTGNTILLASRLKLDLMSYDLLVTSPRRHAQTARRLLPKQYAPEPDSVKVRNSWQEVRRDNRGRRGGTGNGRKLPGIAAERFVTR
jgi:hypothetical protein